MFYPDTNSSSESFFFRQAHVAVITLYIEYTDSKYMLGVLEFKGMGALTSLDKMLPFDMMSGCWSVYPVTMAPHGLCSVSVLLDGLHGFRNMRSVLADSGVRHTW